MSEPFISTAAWWSSRSTSPHPWKDSSTSPPPKPKRPLIPEHADALSRTRVAVLRAASRAGIKDAIKSVDTTSAKDALDMVGHVLHDVLDVSSDFLEMVPIPGLSKTAKILVEIWDALEGVETNKLACLHLTERAADLLYSICLEIEIASPDTRDRLQDPLLTLEDSFNQLHDLVEKQARRPFLKRYLKRDEDARKIEACEKSLDTAMQKFGNTVALRMFDRVVQVERHMIDLKDAIGRSSSDINTPRPLTPATTPPSSSLGLVFAPSATTLVPQSPTSPRAFAFDLPPSAPQPTVDVVEQVKEAYAARAKAGAALDRRDMLDRIRETLRDGSDVALFHLLQVPQSDLPEAQFALRRALDTLSADPGSLSDEGRQFHREFMEFGVDALHRLSDYRAVPNYTVTKYEFDREDLIGMGSFANVYRGTWGEQSIAIKILSPATSKSTFRREVEIWRMLRHRHVLPLWGASSPDAGSPFFCISPFMHNGALPQYMRRVHCLPEVRLRLMHEIVMGMAYLHSQEVIHGDLKAANVLVDDQNHCLIADFGQSDIRSEVYRLSGQSPPHGTVRWTAPELLFGEGDLTTETDMYAFAVTCSEVLNNGEVPWTRVEDLIVRQLVLEGRRPTLPVTFEAKMLAPHMTSWWAAQPTSRPSFAVVERIFEQLRGVQPGWDTSDADGTLKPPTARTLSDSLFTPPFKPLPALPEDDGSYVEVSSASSESYYSAVTHYAVPSTKSSGTGSDSESENTDYYVRRRPSPSPKDHTAAYRRDERRYRQRLQHTFNESLRLPLWTPTKVELGAVGFMNRGIGGTFVTLFNAFHPPESSGLSALSASHGHRMDKRESRPAPSRPRSSSRISRLPQTIANLFSQEEPPKAQPPMEDLDQSFKLHYGRKEAFLFTESTSYRYLESLDPAKAWFSSNISAILEKYGSTHKLQREDVFLIVGTLDAAAWAAYVCHCSADTSMRLKVFPHASRQLGKPWATFANGVCNADSFGPSYEEDTFPTDANWKVSDAQLPYRPENEWDSVLLARLRFKPDRDSPTSGP